MGEALEIENVARLRKQELMFAIMKKRAKAGEQVFGDGVLEVLPDGFGFLRSIEASYMASTDDIYLSPSQIRRFNLHTGDMVEGEVRVPKDGERYFALVKVDRVNGLTPEESKHKIMFENLTPLFPRSSSSSNATSRAKRTSPAASSTSSRPSAKASARCSWRSPRPARR
jgi:transcription termination factor Rho